MLPDESVAVHVTIVSPSGNTAGASLVMSGLESTISSDVVIPISIAMPVLSDISISRVGGTTIDGEVVSSTKIFWESEEVLPDESVAVHVTIVSPSGNTAGASLVIEDTST